MFGYILPEKPEMKIKEYELFKAFYCGVCKSIGKRHGQIPRLTLNYDSAFLAILLSSLAGRKTGAGRQRCIVHPVMKRNYIISDDIIDYISDINILLAYYNFKDNWADEKSVISAAGMMALWSSFKKLRSRYPEKCDIIERKLNELSELEKEKCCSMDKAAEPFAKLMEEILYYAPLCADDKCERILRWIGYNIGKWVYILDAYDDLEDDIKRKRYNPLAYQYHYNNENVSEFKSGIRDRVEFNLTHSLSEITKAYELLEIKNYQGIIENIIYMGMLRKTEKILMTGSCEDIEKSV